MRRRQVLIGLAAAAGLQLCTSGVALAAGFADEIVVQLRQQGFGSIVVERTWLGRTRILAERNDARREIILNPNTGEILRDLWLSKSGKPVQGARISDDDRGDNSGHGGGGDDADDDDDDDSGGSGDDDGDDDDEADDNSGSGSGDD